IRCFKQAVTIGKPAFRVGEGATLESTSVQHLHPSQSVLELHPISADILNRSRPHRAGNQGQVFQPTIPPCHCIRHQLVPVFACSRPHNTGAILLGSRGHPFHAQVQHSAVKVLHQNEVASPTQQ